MPLILRKPTENRQKQKLDMLFLTLCGKVKPEGNEMK